MITTAIGTTTDGNNGERETLDSTAGSDHDHHPDDDGSSYCSALYRDTQEPGVTRSGHRSTFQRYEYQLQQYPTSTLYGVVWVTRTGV